MKNQLISFVCLACFLVAVVQAQTDCVKILATGDFGTSDFGSQLSTFFSTQAGVNTLGCSNKASALFLLGDNFYTFGVWSTSDSKWKSMYETPFSHANLQNIPHYVIAGNHDHYSLMGIKPQLKYNTQNEWTFPAKYYDRLIDQNGVKIYCVFTESWDLVGGDSSLSFGRLLEGYEKNVDEETAEHLRKNFLPPLPETDKSSRRRLQSIVDTEQLDRIEEKLASQTAQTADWLIVLGHYPVRSALTGSHGDTVAFVTQLEPLMKRYKVDAYFAGHDHVSQIIDRQDGSPIYYGNGAGGKTDSGVNKNYPGLKHYVENAFGFMSHVFTKTRMTTKIHYRDPSTKQEKVIEFSQSQIVQPAFDCGSVTCGAQCYFHRDKQCAWSTPLNKCVKDVTDTTDPDEFSKGTGCIDCEVFPCGKTCHENRQFGCSWSSTDFPPKFIGLHGVGTCVQNFAKQTEEDEMNNGNCGSNAVVEEPAIVQPADPTPVIVGGVIGSLAFVGLAAGLVVVQRRRKQSLQRQESERISKHSSSVVMSFAVESVNPAFTNGTALNV